MLPESEPASTLLSKAQAVLQLDPSSLLPEKGQGRAGKIGWAAQTQPP